MRAKVSDEKDRLLIAGLARANYHLPLNFWPKVSYPVRASVV